MTLSHRACKGLEGFVSWEGGQFSSGRGKHAGKQLVLTGKRWVRSARVRYEDACGRWEKAGRCDTALGHFRVHRISHVDQAAVSEGLREREIVTSTANPSLWNETQLRYTYFPAQAASCSVEDGQEHNSRDAYALSVAELDRPSAERLPVMGWVEKLRRMNHWARLLCSLCSVIIAVVLILLRNSIQ